MGRIYIKASVTIMLIQYFLSPVKNTNQKLTGEALGFFPGCVWGWGVDPQTGHGDGRRAVDFIRGQALDCRGWDLLTWLLGDRH